MTSNLVRFSHKSRSGNCNGYQLNEDIFTIRHCASDRFDRTVYQSDTSIRVLVRDVEIIAKTAIPPMRAHSGVTLDMMRQYASRFHIAGINPQNGSSVRKMLMDFIGFSGWSGSPVVYNAGTPGDYTNCLRVGHFSGVYTDATQGGIFHILGLGQVTNRGGSFNRMS